VASEETDSGDAEGGIKMKPDRQLIDKIKKDHDSRYLSAMQKLAAGDSCGAEEDLRYFNLSSQVLAVQRKNWFYVRTLAFNRKNWLYGGIVFCILIFMLLCVIPCPSTDIRLEIETENLTFTLARDWAADHQILAERVEVDNIVGFNRQIYPEEEAASISLTGEDIIINEIVMMKGTKGELSAQGGTVKLFAKEFPIGGELYVYRAALTLETPEQSLEKNFDSEIGDTLNFRSAKTVGYPVLLEFFAKNWQFDGLQAEHIGFLEETKPGSGDFRSAIVSGKIIFLETGTEKELKERDNVILKRLNCSRLDISKSESGKGMKVYFEGSAGRILSGPQDFERDLTMTVMQWLWNQKVMGIILLALLSFLGRNFYTGD